MTGITPEAFVLGLSGLGAGLAMICGIGTVLDRVMQLVEPLKA